MAGKFEFPFASICPKISLVYIKFFLFLYFFPFFSLYITFISLKIIFFFSVLFEFCCRVFRGFFLSFYCVQKGGKFHLFAAELGSGRGAGKFSRPKKFWILLWSFVWMRAADDRIFMIFFGIFAYLWLQHWNIYVFVCGATECFNVFLFKGARARGKSFECWNFRKKLFQFVENRQKIEFSSKGWQKTLKNLLEMARKLISLHFLRVEC